MRYHNFFEKKEIEYRNKIIENFGKKNNQIHEILAKTENKINFNKGYNTNKDENNKNERNPHHNIIKIIL